MKDFINEFGIEFKEDKDKYEIDLIDSNEFQNVFLYLDGNDEFEELENENEINVEHNIITYKKDDWYVTIDANFKDDTYKVIVERKK